MAEFISWFNEIKEGQLELVGGKGLNLGLMTNQKFPVPEGFVITTNAYFSFLDQARLRKKVISIADSINVDDTNNLQEKSKEIRELIKKKEVPGEIQAEILKDYLKLGNSKVGWLSSSELTFVAVRSSASAEDLPEASFAGQQETFLNVKGKEEVINAVKNCWASLFTARAIYYRKKNNFPEDKVGIAVVIQRMVDSDASGVMFTSSPTGDQNKIIVESVFGLGEAIVSGSVTPDNHVLNKQTLNVENKKISSQEWALKRKGKNTEKIMLKEEGKQQKITDQQVQALGAIGKKIESYYKRPQDIEFAFEKGKLYIVQSRAITTLKLQEKKNKEETLKEITANKLLNGLAASPGIASGKVRILLAISQSDKLEAGEILVTKMTNPDWVPLMKKSGGIVTNEGGVTCHAAIVSRELGIPCIVGSTNATTVLKNEQEVTVNGFDGNVYEGRIQLEVEEKLKEFTPLTSKEASDLKKIVKEQAEVIKKTEEESEEETEKKIEEEFIKKRIEEERSRILEEGKEELKVLVQGHTGDSDRKDELALITELLERIAVRVKANVAFPESAKRAAETGADGVGLLRAEHMITASSVHPAHYIRLGQYDELTRVIRVGIENVAKYFPGKPVWYRTFDARTDEFRALKGGELEPDEENPMIGWHGIRRDLDKPMLFKSQVLAIKQLHDKGYTNVGIMLPFITHAEQVRKAKELMREINFDPKENKVDFGIMVETPAAVWSIKELLAEGIDFASFGTNDLTQLTLGVDRNNERIQKWFSELHPSILRSIKYVIRKCNKKGVQTSICGQAGSNPEMVRHLVHFGIKSISANIDAVENIRQVVLEEEKRLILGTIHRD